VHYVGALKVANLHCSRQQCIVVKWSGRSVAGRVRARVREWNFSLFFFFCVKVREKNLWHNVKLHKVNVENNLTIVIVMMM